MAERSKSTPATTAKPAGKRGKGSDNLLDD